MDHLALRTRLADLVATVTDGVVPADKALADGASLADLGMNSLGFLRLIDAIELDYGIELPLDGSEPLPDSIDALVGHLARHGLKLG